MWKKIALLLKESKEVEMGILSYRNRKEKIEMEERLGFLSCVITVYHQ